MINALLHNYFSFKILKRSLKIYGISVSKNWAGSWEKRVALFQKIYILQIKIVRFLHQEPDNEYVNFMFTMYVIVFLKFLFVLLYILLFNISI